MKIYHYTLSILLLIFAACNSEDKKNDQDSDTLTRDTAFNVDNERAGELDTADVSFFKKAAMSGMTEVEAGSRMLIASQDSAVKKFARAMVTDHNAANLKLKELASSKGITLPAELPIDKVELIKKIDAFKNDGRNEYYAHLMVEDHERAIDLFNRASNSSDADISSFAKATLPLLEHHYKMAKDLESKVTAHKRNQGDDPLKLSDKKTMKH